MTIELQNIGKDTDNLDTRVREALAAVQLVASSLTCPPNVMTVSTCIVSEFNQGSVANGMCMAVICVVITTTLLIALNTVSGKDKS